MVERRRALRAWILRRAALSGSALLLVILMFGRVAGSTAYPGWLRVVCLPLLAVVAAPLVLDLSDVAARARRRRRPPGELLQPAVALVLALLVATAPRLLQDSVVAPASPPLRLRPRPPAAAEESTPPQIHAPIAALHGPLDPAAPGPAPAAEPAKEPPPPAPPPPAAAPLASPTPLETPPYESLETLRFRPELDAFRPAARARAGEDPAALPVSLRVEMVVFVDDLDEAEGSGIVVEASFPFGPDEGVRLIAQTVSDSAGENLFDDGPAWDWRRARVDYVRRLGFDTLGIDLRVSAGLAYDRLRLTEEIALSNMRGAAPVLGLEAVLLEDGPVRIVLHAAYTPATDFDGHRASIAEVGAIAFVRLSGNLRLTIGWRRLELRMREEEEGPARAWGDVLAGPSVGLEMRF